MSFVVELTNNITLLLSLLFIFGLAKPRLKKLSSRQQGIIQGIIFGLFAVVAMLNPIEVTPGFLMDGRGIVLSIASVFGGVIPGVITALFVSIYRLSLGGMGAPLGLASAVSMVILGLLIRQFLAQRMRPITPVWLFGVGLIQALVVLFWSSQVASPLREQILESITLPVLTVYPLGILLGGVVFLYMERQAELTENLRSSEERFRTIAELLPVPILLYRQSDETVLYINNQFTSAHEIKDQELIGQKLPDFYVEMQARQRIKEILQSEGKVHSVEVQCKRLSDGQTFWALVTIEPLMFLGEPAMLALYVDVTKRRMMEAALRKSERTLKQAQAVGHVGSWEVDLDTGKMLWSDEFYRICGIEPGSVEPSSELDISLTYPEDRGKMMEAFDCAIQNNSPYYLEKRIVRPSNEVRWVVSQGEIIDDLAGRKKLIGTFIDITEIKKAEMEMRRVNDELKRANREVQQFANIISHDLRAPLINLKGFSAVLKKSFDKIVSLDEIVRPLLDESQSQTWDVVTSDKIPSSLQFINNSVDRMDTYTSSILKLSRLGRHELKYEHVSTQALVQSVIEALTAQIVKHQISVQVDELPDIQADQFALDQIFTNIISNAVKYMPKNRPGTIHIYAEDDPLQTTFHIEDSGRGIAESDYDKVFAPFRRAGMQDVEGEGMGLAYVQSLVRRHGGEIWFDSTLSLGSTFSFSIPKSTAKAVAHKAK